jgi:hypothetical protein
MYYFALYSSDVLVYVQGFRTELWEYDIFRIYAYFSNNIIIT